MRFAYSDNLSAARQRIYRKSDAIGTLGIPVGLALGDDVQALGDALKADQRVAVQAVCQRMIDQLTAGNAHLADA